MKVRKRDGGEEEFDEIKVISAIIKAGGGIETAETIVEELKQSFGDKEVVSSSEIREFVLSKLGEVEPKARQNWERFDRQVKGYS